MAYTTINKYKDHHGTMTWSGNNSTQTITFAAYNDSAQFQPDWTWIKKRNATEDHRIVDAVRGATKDIYSNLTSVEGTNTNGLTAFNSDGFVLGSDGGYNGSGGTYVGWNWKAGGASPAITYAVKVVSDSGNKYRFDDFGTSAVTLDLQEGGTYTFDQSDSSNSGHPLRFSTTSNGSHGGGSEYTTGVTTNGTPGSSGAYTRITVAASAPTLYYYCTNHSAMGGQANTNSTFGSSNFGGSTQSTVSANTTAGFSVVSYTGNGSAGATVGHGLGVSPNIVIIKRRSSSEAWPFWSSSLAGNTSYLRLNATDAVGTASDLFNSTTPSNSLVTLGTGGFSNTNTETYVMYCFAEKTGYSKFGSYTGNNSNDGTFVYTGFKPAWVMIKRYDSTASWFLFDSKRDPSNGVTQALLPNSSNAEETNSTPPIDFLSNGFKLRYAHPNFNTGSYIYMAFGQSIVGSNNIPATAR